MTYRPGRSLWAFFKAFWQTERGLSALLVSLVLALFVGAPLVAMGVAGKFLFDAFFTLLLLSGVAAVSQRRLLSFGVSAVALATVAVRWTGHLRPGSALGVWDDTLSIASLSILTVLVLMQVFRDGPITSYRIQGAIAVYLLLGLIWTSVYELLYRTLPGAFHFAAEDTSALLNMHGLVYYSFVTLTTVGYGDITPVHPLARSLAMGEALCGQLYPAILIARLVSLEIDARRRK